MKRFLPFLFMLCAINSFASYLTTRTNGTVFYADPECTQVAESGITKGNTYYFDENSQTADGVVCFSFGEDIVYAKRSDVDTFTDEEFESAGPTDDITEAYYSGSTSWRMPAWLKWIIALALVYAMYKLAPKLLLRGKESVVTQPEPVEPEEPIAEKYGADSQGCIEAFYHDLDFRERLKELNRLAAHNPGKETTDAEALRNYLMELQPALRTFLREASGERQFTADPHFRDARKLNSEGEGCREWLYVQLRGKEYVDPERLRQLDHLKFEIYVSENLSRHLRSDRDRHMLEKRLKTSLAHIGDYDTADRKRIYSMLWDLKRKTDPEEAYGYICKAVELGYTPYPKEKMEKKYGTTADGQLDMGAYKRKNVLKWVCIGAIGVAVIAALLLLALYVALFAFFAFCLYVTFKMMISDATDRNRPTSPTVFSHDDTAHNCGQCKLLGTPSCPLNDEGVNSSDPACGMFQI